MNTTTDRNTHKWRTFTRPVTIFFGAVYVLLGVVLVAYGLVGIMTNDQEFRESARYVIYGVTVACMLAGWISARRVGDEARKVVDWMMVLPIFFVWGVAKPAVAWVLGEGP
jgi:uncharacterized membrane protein